MTPNPLSLSDMPSLFFRLALISAIIAGPLQAVPLRVATYNVKLGLEAPGTTGHDAALSVLARIDADVVALQEVYIADSNAGYLTSFATDLGYPHRFLTASALDTQARVAILSKYPFVANSTKNIVSPPGANDVTRAAAAVRVDVPGTDNDPYFISAHLKCCLQRVSDPFRRAVEMIRVRNYLNAEGIDGGDNVFFLGDFNLIGSDQIFSSPPADLPVSYVLGNDITFDVSYFSNPTSYFTAEGLVNPGYLQQNGTSSSTFIGGGILDYILVSESLAARDPVTEVYNSQLDATFPGIPKSGSPLPSNTSSAASDHYVVLGDFELDGGPLLQISIAPNNLSESSPPAEITVTLPAPATSTQTVSLTSSDETEAIPGTPTLVFETGETEKSTSLIPQSDNTLDGDQTLEIQVSSPGYNGASATVIVSDSDLSYYPIAGINTPIIETFDQFEGLNAPAQWTTTGLNWIGPDDGTSAAPGARSYGGGALGILTTSPASLSAGFRNTTGSTITSLRVDYLASQWRSSLNGSADQLSVSLVTDEQINQIPLLNFLADISLPTGPVTPPAQVALGTYLRGLDIAPGEDASLIFELLPGTLGPAPSSDVFVNEFHYDNQSSDEGEFIEIVVGQAFDGDLSDVIIYFYNGSNGTVYDTHALSSFTESSPAPSGHRIFWKDIAGIQNGAPDGFALVIDGLVKDFLSYEGVLTAMEGPANGLTSTNIGVAQNGNSVAGQNSLALAGSGSNGNDFTWTTQAGPFTKGSLNAGQTFGASSSPQGIGIDELTVVALADQDGDLLPDEEEIALGTNPNDPDSDGDGQDDFFEAILAETDPLSASSFLKITLTVDNSGLLTISLPTLEGRNYRIEATTDLVTWVPGPIYVGDGAPLTLVFPENGVMYFRTRISAP